MISIHDQLKLAQENVKQLQRDMRDAQLEALRTAPRNSAGNYSPSMSRILADAAAPYVPEIQQAQAVVSRLDWMARDEQHQLTGALPD